MIKTLVLGAIAALLSLFGEVILGWAMELLSKISNYSLNIGDTIDSFTVDGDLISTLSGLMFNVGMAFLLLNFVYRGLQTYILYTDGDPDADPIGFLTLYCKAVVVICTYDYIFQMFSDGVDSLIGSVLNIIKRKLNTNLTVDSVVTSLFSLDENNIKGGLMGGILGIVFGIIAIIVCFRALKTGFELLLLNIGMPIAAMGLLNQDKGIFKGYFMSICKGFATLLISIGCAQLGCSVMLAASDSIVTSTIDGLIGIIIGIVILAVALTAPRLLSEFMAPSGGGQGMMMKMYYASSMASRVNAGMHHTASRIREFFIR